MPSTTDRCTPERPRCHPGRQPGRLLRDTKDGFGLDGSDGASAYSAEYYGANKIRDKVQLAPNAVVLLMHLCYAAGNGEPWMGPEFDKSLATKRVDNYANGFLDVGARAVFAFGGQQQVDFPNALANSNKTMDEIFMSSTSDARQYNNGFNGWDDYDRDSQRTPWARLHLDPNPHEGHYRAVSGDLGMTAAHWRGQDAPPDTKPPTLTIRGALADGHVVAADAATKRVGPDTFSVTVHITHKGKAGAFRVEVVGTDVGGGHQAGTRTVHIS